MPFPYVKEKMPLLPDTVLDWVKNDYNNYEYASSEAVLVKPLDDAVAFANKRKVALMCDEWGTRMEYAANEDRVNWYKLKSKWMDERNIIRVSWGYRESFGLFNNPSLKHYEAKYPEDLNAEVLQAMGFNVPSLSPRLHATWLDAAKKKNDYTIYKNGFVENILCDDSWLNDGSIMEAKSMLFKKDSSDTPYYIYMDQSQPYGRLDIDFSGDCDFTSLVKSDKALEFEIRSNQKEITLEIYFKQKEISGTGKAGLPWRCQVMLKNDTVPADGKWHTIRIPLKKFNDIGAYSNVQQKWFNSEGLFNWKKVNYLVFDLGEKGLQNDLSIRSIAIK